MPLYDYKCSICNNIFEKIVKLKDWELMQACPECNSQANRAIVHGHGGMQDDTPKWLDDEVRCVLQNPLERRTNPIVSRKQLAEHLKKNKINPMC